MRTLLIRLIDDDRAQDLMEYALLTAGIGIVGVAAWPAIETGLRVAYTAFSTNSYNLWEPPAPGAGS